MDNSQDKKDALSSVVNTTLRCANEETRDRDRDGPSGSVVEKPRMPRGIGSVSVCTSALYGK
jgi:hypothetical protein